MHHVAPQLHVTFRRLVPPAPRPDTRDTRDFLLFFFFFSFRPPPLPLSLSRSLLLSLSPSLSLSRADFVEFVSSPLPPQSSYLLLLLLAACSLFIFYSSLRVFSSAAFPWWTWFRGKAGPRRSAPSTPPPPARRSIGIRGPAARGPRSRSLARKIRGAVGPVRSRRLRFCALMPTPSSSFFFFSCSNFLSPPVRRFNGPMRERISMISCSLAEERLRFGEGGGLIRCLDGSEGFDCCSIERGDGKKERERYIVRLRES